MTQKTEIAVLGGGCFWCVEAVFKRLKGVTRVESGYAGGHVSNPSYEQVCKGDTGHAEVCRIEFDPETIDFDGILRVFFKIHDPTTKDRQGDDVGPQYRSVIFATSAAQLQRAREIIAELDRSGAYPAPIVTEVTPLPNFYRAEDYHQDYFAKNPDQGYCALVVRPKVDKFEAAFRSQLKAGI